MPAGQGPAGICFDGLTHAHSRGHVNRYGVGEVHGLVRQGVAPSDVAVQHEGEVLSSFCVGVRGQANGDRCGSRSAFNRRCVCKRRCDRAFFDLLCHFEGGRYVISRGRRGNGPFENLINGYRFHARIGHMDVESRPSEYEFLGGNNEDLLVVILRVAVRYYFRGLIETAGSQEVAGPVLEPGGETLCRNHVICVRHVAHKGGVSEPDHGRGTNYQRDNRDQELLSVPFVFICCRFCLLFHRDMRVPKANQERGDMT